MANTNIERRRILVQGIVQGVGFRPFVYGQALQHGLCGFVLNDSAGVTIEVEGEVGALAAFERALREQPPPLSRVDKVVAETLSPRGDHAFVIAQSQAGDKRRTLIAHDSATCGDCLRELLDPADRRYGYPFINCTNCGPRFTIVQDVPYDRDKTTMRVFPMCPDCRAEYENPLDRRFHAQPNACAACGPQMHFEWWSQEDERRTTNDERQDSSFVIRPSSPVDPIAVAAHALAAGAILAIKGLGGYHLACDALNVEVVARLRRRKHREAKPFALMAPDLATARMVCQVSAAEAEVLESRRRPIVLLRRDPGARVTVAPGVAPAYATLGLMLPYTPLHHLLLRAFAAAAGPDRPALLVLTSGNMSDEPIAYRDDDARERLASIAEGMLTHNRAIHMRCDDSVVHVVRGGEVRMDRTDTIYGVRTVPLRRSRGYAPEPIPLAFESPVPLLAVGGHLKNTFCLLKGRQAFVSHHIGDLENLETLTSFREGIEHFERLFDIAPLAVAYDLHPEYLATKEAFALAEAWGQGSGVRGQETGDGESQAAQTPDPRSPIPDPQLIGVQHHHAHIASVLAEHGLAGPAIGVAADGTGYGTDGAIWGCEILRADLLDFERLAHLAYVPLPGGERAVRQPWRMAAAYLQHAYGDAFLDLDIPFVRAGLAARWRPLAQMIARGVNSPPASSLGRLFDAVAALVGLRNEVVYEGQAAIELEMLAVLDEQFYPFAIAPAASNGPILDVIPMLQAIVGDIQRGTPVALIAGRFHRSVAELLAAACVRARESSGLDMVALSGGVFQNRLLLELLLARLAALDFHAYVNQRVPPNDGGLSFGQASVAAARLQQQLRERRTPD